MNHRSIIFRNDTFCIVCFVLKFTWQHSRIQKCFILFLIYLKIFTDTFLIWVLPVVQHSLTKLLKESSVLDMDSYSMLPKIMLCLKSLLWRHFAFLPFEFFSPESLPSIRMQPCLSRMWIIYLFYIFFLLFLSFLDLYHQKYLMQNVFWCSLWKAVVLQRRLRNAWFLWRFNVFFSKELLLIINIKYVTEWNFWNFVVFVGS